MNYYFSVDLHKKNISTVTQSFFLEFKYTSNLVVGEGKALLFLFSKINSSLIILIDILVKIVIPNLSTFTLNF